MEAFTLIRNQYESFSKNGQKIAHFILTNPNEFLASKTAEIGEKTHTSASAVTRFSQKLGFKNLEKLKISVAQGISERPEPQLSILDPIVSKDDDVEVICEKLRQKVEHAIDDTLYLLNKNRLAEAIEKIESAHQIYFYGIGSSALTAYDLYHKFNRAGKKSSFDFDSHMGLEFSSYTTPNDVVVAVSHRGETHEVLLPVSQAKKNGTPIIAISGAEKSTLVEQADIPLLFSATELGRRVGAISSKFASMAVGDALFLGYVQNHLESIETQMIQTETLVKLLQ